MGFFYTMLFNSSNLQHFIMLDLHVCILQHKAIVIRTKKTCFTAFIFLGYLFIFYPRQAG